MCAPKPTPWLAECSSCLIDRSDLVLIECNLKQFANQVLKDDKIMTDLSQALVVVGNCKNTHHLRVWNNKPFSTLIYLSLIISVCLTPPRVYLAKNTGESGPNILTFAKHDKTLLQNGRLPQFSDAGSWQPLSWGKSASSACSHSGKHDPYRWRSHNAAAFSPGIFWNMLQCACIYWACHSTVRCTWLLGDITAGSRNTVSFSERAPINVAMSLNEREREKRGRERGREWKSG